MDLTEYKAQQEKIRQSFEQFINDNKTRQKGSVNGMLQGEFYGSDPEEESATLLFTVLPWEVNRVGILHGGIIATMMDHVCGLTSSYFSDAWAPTVNMNLNFIRPASVGDILLATGKVSSCGKKIIHMKGTLVNQATGKEIANCTAVFLNKKG